MRVEEIIISAAVGALASIITAYITTRLNIRQEREKWKREFTIKYAETQAMDPKRAQSIATQFALGFLIIERVKPYEREKIFVPPSCRLLAGRGEQNEIDTKDGLTSGRHSAFSADQSNVYVEDLGTKNGTFVNGNRIHGRHKLESGDIIKIGATKIEFNKI